MRLGSSVRMCVGGEGICECLLWMALSPIPSMERGGDTDVESHVLVSHTLGV